MISLKRTLQVHVGCCNTGISKHLLTTTGSPAVDATMSAVTQVLNINELLEHIISQMPILSIPPTSLVCKQWRIVVHGSHQLKKLANPQRAISMSELEQLDRADGHALLFQQPSVDCHIARHWINSGRKPVNIELLCLWDEESNLESRPHYNVVLGLEIEASLKPDFQSRGFASPLGTIVRFFLPKTTSPDAKHLDATLPLTCPPITAVKVEFTDGKRVEAVDRFNTLNSCFLHVPKGISIGDVLAVQKAMLETDRRYRYRSKWEVERRCIVSFAVDVEPGRLAVVDWEQYVG